MIILVVIYTVLKKWYRFKRKTSPGEIYLGPVPINLKVGMNYIVKEEYPTLYLFITEGNGVFKHSPNHRLITVGSSQGALIAKVGA